MKFDPQRTGATAWARWSGFKARHWLGMGIGAAVMSGLIAVELAAESSGSTPPTTKDSIEVVIDDLAPAIPINPLLFGVHVGEVGHGSFSPTTPFAEPNGLSLRGIRSLRTFGCGADMLHWRTIVGPIEERVRYSHSNPCFHNDVRQLYDAGPIFPMNLEWGIDEIFGFADNGGADIVGTVNFGTGSAQEAANFVDYANSPSPDPGCDGADGKMIRGWTPGLYAGADPAPAGYFACLRHFFGRQEPYGVTYWEVGNEITGHSSATWTTDTRHYYQGGSETIAPGFVTSDSSRHNWSGKRRQTSCEPDQKFYVMFPPIAETSTRLVAQLIQNHRTCGKGEISGVCKWSPTLLSRGSKWTEVDSLDEVGPEDRVFSVDHAAGSIQFGDGVHGAIPDCSQEAGKGYEVVLDSYKSGHHSGFVGFEFAMKRVDPTIRVGSGHPYPPLDPDLRASLDFIVMHPYMAASGPDLSARKGASQAPPIDAFRPALMSWSHRMVDTTVDRYREVFRRDIEILWTEWSMAHAFEGVPPTPVYTTSLDMGLFVADMLRAAIVHRITAAHYFSLGSGVRAKASHREQGHGLATFGEPKLGKSGVRRSIVMQPAGLVFEMFGDYFGESALETTATNVPEFSACWPTCSGGWEAPNMYPAGPRDYPVLEALASRHTDGRIAVALINKSLDQSLDVSIRLTSETPLEGDGKWVVLDSRDADLHPGKVTNSEHDSQAVAVTAREVAWKSPMTVRLEPHTFNILVSPIRRGTE